MPTRSTPSVPHDELLARGFLFEQQFAKVAVLHKGALSLYRHPSTGLFATLLTYGENGWDLMLSVDHTNRRAATWEAVDRALACVRGTEGSESTQSDLPPILPVKHRIATARDPMTSASSLHALALDPDAIVRAGVAQNSSTHGLTLVGLTADESPDVAAKARAGLTLRF